MRIRIISVIVISMFICQQTYFNRYDNSFIKIESGFIAFLNNENCNLEIKMNVEIRLGSVTVKKDTLYFEYKLINNSAKNLLFYHIQSLNIKLESLTESNYPKCSIYIINSNKKLPDNAIVRHRDYFVVDSNNNITIQNLYKKAQIQDKEYSYILLPAGNYKTFIGKIYIGEYQLLGKSFELKLRYLSSYNKHFINQFKMMQSKNPKLKEYEKYEGVIESNCIPFTLY